MMRGVSIGALLVATLVACSEPDPVVDDTLTGLELSVTNSSGIALNQIRVTGRDELRAILFGPVTAPNPPAELASEESLVILLEESLDGTLVLVEVEGIPVDETERAPLEEVPALLRAQNVVAVAVLFEEGAAFCGDGTCDPNEDRCNCVADCSPECGDGCCTDGETEMGCPVDCASECGDSACTGLENQCTCDIDCERFCGDGCCTRPAEKEKNCPEDCTG